MLKLKASTRVDGLKAEMYFALGLADQAYADEGAECIVTAALNGIHNSGSLHPQGWAVDLRTEQLNAQQHQIIWSKLQRLNRYGFDVADEAIGATPHTTAPHFHIEFQPKPGETFWHTENP